MATTDDVSNADRSPEIERRVVVSISDYLAARHGSGPSLNPSGCERTRAMVLEAAARSETAEPSDDDELNARRLSAIHEELTMLYPRFLRDPRCAGDDFVAESRRDVVETIRWIVADGWRPGAGHTTRRHAAQRDRPTGVRRRRKTSVTGDEISDDWLRDEWWRVQDSVPRAVRGMLWSLAISAVMWAVVAAALVWLFWH